MRRLGTIFTTVNATLKFKATNPKKLTTYVGVLKRYDSSGGAPVVTWTPNQLKAGVTAVLTPALGYDVLIIPQPSSTPASITLDITVGNEHRTKTVSDIDSHESIGWSIFFK